MKLFVISYLGARLERDGNRKKVGAKNKGEALDAYIEYMENKYGDDEFVYDLCYINEDAIVEDN